MARELKESLLPWLSGQVLPSAPTLAEDDGLARRWIGEVVLVRRHRTTGRIVGQAWAEERPRLSPIPPRILEGLAGGPRTAPAAAVVIDLEQRRRGERAQARDLAEDAAAL